MNCRQVFHILLDAAHFRLAIAFKSSLIPKATLIAYGRSGGLAYCILSAIHISLSKLSKEGRERPSQKSQALTHLLITLPLPSPPFLPCSFSATSSPNDGIPRTANPVFHHATRKPLEPHPPSASDFPAVA